MAPGDLLSTLRKYFGYTARTPDAVDRLAEMPIGRIPARSASEASAMIGKILAFGKGGSGSGVTLVSDFDDTFQFSGTNAKVRARLPQDAAAEFISAGSTPDAKQRLIESLRKGPKLVNYAGHGSVDLWRSNLLTSADARALESGGKVGVFIMMTCLNGYYQSPLLESLAESLLKAPGGAAAVWASSGFTVPIDQEVLDVSAIGALYSTKGTTLGRAFRRAKSAVGDPDVRKTWILLGDPTMVFEK